MKVLIPTMGTRGDIQPYIALAKKLKDSGYEPIIATHPCWEVLINQYEIQFYPIGPNIDIEYEAAVIRSKSKLWLIGAIKTMKFMFKIIEKSSLEIKELCSSADLVIVSHSQIGAAEAEALGIPYISVTLQPDVIPMKKEEKGFIKALTTNIFTTFISPFMVGPYNRLRKNLGLKKVRTFDELLSPFLNLIPISPQVYPKNKLWEDRNQVVGYWFSNEYEKYMPPKSLVSFLNDGTPPIVIALGAMGFESNEEKTKLDILVNSINNTGMRAIIQGFTRTLEGYPLPDNIISVESIPHSWLFKQAYCVIHHGGFGTTASAIKAGVPSIVIPHVLDQYFWGNRVCELGIGTKPINSKDLNEKSLREAIVTLRENYSRISNRVKKLSEKVSEEDGLGYTVKLIEDTLEKI